MHIHKKNYVPENVESKKTSQTETDNISNQSGIDQSEDHSQSSTFQNDHSEAKTENSHEQPANNVSFGEPQGNASAKSSRSALQELQQLFKEKTPVTDPAVLKLLDYVRNMENENIQHMLDMMQQSLDRAHEIMEKNKAHYYKETLPKLEGIKKQIETRQVQVSKQEISETQQSQEQKNKNQTSGQREVAQKLQLLTREVQQVADTVVPPHHGALMLELEQALQMALIL